MRPGFCIVPEKVTNQNRNILLNLFQYFFLNFMIHFKRSETIKLTVAPMTAKIIVFTISSERILGMILKNVPETVPIGRLLFGSISRQINVILILTEGIFNVLTGALIVGNFSKGSIINSNLTDG